MDYLKPRVLTPQNSSAFFFWCLYRVTDNDSNYNQPLFITWKCHNLNFSLCSVVWVLRTQMLQVRWHNSWNPISRSMCHLCKLKKNLLSSKQFQFMEISYSKKGPEMHSGSTKMARIFMTGWSLTFAWFVYVYMYYGRDRSMIRRGGSMQLLSSIDIYNSLTSNQKIKFKRKLLL